MIWEEPDPAEIVSLADDAAWEGLRRRYDPNHIGRPWERCLEVARSTGARSAVIETRYLDLDYRSEFSSFFSKTFAHIPDTAHRVHFFDSAVGSGDLARLASRIVAGYLGYVVLRPSPLGRVGRTMLRPPPDLTKAVQATVVEDTVHFFGQTLAISGVPFAQQDTQFGRCAHVAAWICHYTAHLRGDVPRRPMAEFSLLADASVAEGRPLPSQGLTGLQLSNLMQEFGLPPIVYRMGSLPTSGQEPALPPHDANADPGTWDTRAVAVMCRYLNSGYPVLVGTHEHAFAIVGYRREPRNSPEDPAWITFVRHDDQRGPYLVVKDILNDVDPATMDPYSPWQLILAPVPDKLWLMPEAAERVGRSLLLRYDQLEGSGDFITRDRQREITFRTVAMSSVTYKSVAAERKLDPDSVREIRLARFSRLVWVVEAVDRSLRSAGKKCIVGEAVFDSTSSDTDPNVLALRVPGALLIRQTDGTLRSPLPATDQPVDWTVLAPV